MITIMIWTLTIVKYIYNLWSEKMIIALIYSRKGMTAVIQFQYLLTTFPDLCVIEGNESAI